MLKGDLCGESHDLNLLAQKGNFHVINLFNQSKSIKLPLKFSTADLCPPPPFFREKNCASLNEIEEE